MSLILTGGRVIDPASQTDVLADVVVQDGVVLGIHPIGSAEVAARRADPNVRCIDVSGQLVVPGLIDLHAHVFPGLGDFCVKADQVGVGMGVPTIIDGGTSGVATFDLARAAVIDNPATRTRVLAFIDPNQLYLATKDFICHKLEIANDLRNLDPDLLAASLERNADVLVGCKVRVCHTGDPEVSPFLDAAKAATEKPIMVHLGRFPHTPVISTTSLLRQLRGGDIITHAFRGGGGMLGLDGKAIPEFRDAVDRGVKLDIGHSGTDFRFREARRILDQGYLPDTISTDLNVFNINGPVFTLAETMSKVWALGVDLYDVIAMVTRNPASIIGYGDTLGVLGVGRPAEISVLRIIEGDIGLSDGNETVMTDKALAPVGCLHAGTWYESGVLSSFATVGKTWGPALDESDW
jgi:dihydroorotase